jgi:hypothetical protein
MKATQTLKGLLAFALLLVNVILALWMIFETRRIYLLIFDWVITRRQTQGSDLVRAAYGMQTIDALLLVVLALIALALIVFTETRYRKALEAGRLWRRVFLVFGIQLLYLGVMQLIYAVANSRLSVGWDLGLIILEIAAGINLIILSRRQGQSLALPKT